MRKDETPVRINPSHERSRSGWLLLCVLVAWAWTSARRRKREQDTAAARHRWRGADRGVRSDDAGPASGGDDTAAGGGVPADRADQHDDDAYYFPGPGGYFAEPVIPSPRAGRDDG